MSGPACEPVRPPRVSGPTVRAATAEDVAAIARVQARSWRETYRGVMADSVLDDPGLPAARERSWAATLAEERFARHRVAVAEHRGELVGIAMSGPPEDPDGPWVRQLFVLYVVRAHHGTGAGAALLDAVLDADESAVLWVADPNPRAQAFYRKHGFSADGARSATRGVPTIRMLRPRRDAGAAPSR